MKGLFTKYKAWRSRGKLRSLEKWERERARGKGRFIIRIGLYYGITMIGMTNAYERIFDGAVTDPSILFKLFYYVPAGLTIGAFAWTQRETDYKKALREARAKASALNPNFSQEQLPQETSTTIRF
jgi:hypothetical protein